jgi:hypothetical protein
LSEDRSEELAAAMLAIVCELASDQKDDTAFLAEVAEDRLYELYPDLTTQELDDIALIWLHTILYPSEI